MFRDSQEKQKIRESLWLPAFQRLLKDFSVNDLRYLCFPGAGCCELKFLLSRKVLLLKNVVAVERDNFFATFIERYLNGQGAVFCGDFKELLDRNQRLQNQFINPFHIINIDCYGKANILGSNNADPGLMDILARLVELQHSKGAKKFAVIITLSAEDKTNRFPEFYAWLKKSVNDDALFNSFSDTIEGLDHSIKCITKVIVQSVISSLDVGFQKKYKAELLDPPRIYVGKHTFQGRPHVKHMISYVVYFKHKKWDSSPVNIKLDDIRVIMMKQAMDLVLKTKYIKEAKKK